MLLSELALFLPRNSTNFSKFSTRLARDPASGWGAGAAVLRLLYIAAATSATPAAEKLTVIVALDFDLAETCLAVAGALVVGL